MQVFGQRLMVRAGANLGKATFMGFSLAVSATLMALAVEAPQHFWLGWITLLPLLQAARVLSPLGAFGAGSFWGAFAPGGHAAMGSQNIEFSLSSVAILTLGPALYASFGAILTRRVGLQSVS